MYQVGDKVLYGAHGVCCIVGLEKRTIDRRSVPYYALEPIEQSGTRYYVPKENPLAVAKMCPLLTEQQLKDLLASEDVRKDVWLRDETHRKQRYRELIVSGDRAALLSMIRSLYLHRKQQEETGRRLHLCDENFLRDAEKLLKSEFSSVLGIPQSEVIAYISAQLKD